MTAGVIPEAAGGAQRRRAAPPPLDPVLVGASAVLLTLGLVMVTSASISTAARDLGDPLFYLRRHAAHLTAAVLVMAATVRIPMRFWRRASPWLLLAGVAALALVLVPGVGRSVNGSTRWIELGVVNAQPSEAVKICVVLYLAGYLVRQADAVRSSLGGFLRPLAVVALIAVLLLLEPDYGAVVVLFATALGMLFLGGVPWSTFLAWVALVVAALAGVIVAEPYRMERVISFLDPWSDPFGRGFQLTQALIAIGRGEWLGVGLGASVQKLFYLPEAHTDFLFAVVAEELGLVGAVTVVGLFTIVVWRMIVVGRRAEAAGAPYAAHVAYGAALLLGVQAHVNVGVNLGLLPTKGLTLPLMSYGGSSLLASAFAVALALRVDREVREGGR